MKTTGSIKTRLVTQFLLDKVHNASIEPELLPGEMELCEVLKVSRVTVRRALKWLLEHQYVMKLPGRRGTFTNPDYFGNVPFSVGIVLGNSDGVVFEELTALMLSNFMREMTGMDGFYFDFHFLTYESETQFNRKMETHNIKALLLVMPNASLFPWIEALARTHIPTLVVCSPYLLEHLKLKAGTISRDFAGSGIDNAEFIAENGVARVFYCGIKNTSYIAFRKALQQYNITLDEADTAELPEDIDRILPERLSKGDVDAIYSDGAALRYGRVIQAVRSLPPEIPRPKIFFENVTSARMFQKGNPDLAILIQPKCAIRSFMNAAGILAADMLLKQIKQPETVLTNVKL